MKVVLVTGMSGAGKSAALKILEDLNFEAVDNLPLHLLANLINTDEKQPRSLVIGTDARSRDFSVEAFKNAVERLRANPHIELKVLLLDCANEVLRRRFTETRRRHPLAQDRPVLDGIRLERSLIEKIRNSADIIIDTSDLQINDLRHTMQEYFSDEKQRGLSIFLSSFAYRKGVPRDADLVFDVRFLKNPFYVPELKEKTGNDKDVGAYIASDPDFDQFFSHLTNLLAPLLPRYAQEGKSYLTVAIGCTGGKHRSVYTVEKLAGFLKDLGYNVGIRHRDIH